MSRIDEKLSLMARALTYLAPLRGTQDDDEFMYHATAFLDAAGAARQYIQEDLTGALNAPGDTPQQKWMDDLERNVDVAAVIGLRNSDVHKEAITSHINRHFKVRIAEVLSFGGDHVTARSSSTPRRTLSANCRLVYERTIGIIQHVVSNIRERLDKKRKSEQLQATSSSFAVDYRINTSKLPTSFMTVVNVSVWDRRLVSARGPSRLAKGTGLSMQGAVISHLGSTDLHIIFTNAHAHFVTLVEQARRNGWLM